MNQCDGCLAGYPVTLSDGIHRLPDGSPFMGCEKHRYAISTEDRLTGLEERVKRLESEKIDPPSPPSFPTPLSPTTPPEYIYSNAAKLLTRTWADVTEKQAAKICETARAAYPGVDVVAEIHKASAWETASPRNAKKRHAKFFLSWLDRASQRRLSTNTPAISNVNNSSTLDKQRTQGLLARLRSGDGTVE